MNKFSSEKIFDLVEWVSNLVFGVILLLLTLGILVGAVKLMATLATLLRGGANASYVPLISEVMTLFVVIELARSMADYFKEHHIRITYIADAGIVFLIREVMLGLFSHTLPTQEMYGIAVLLVPLGLLRLGSALVFQRQADISAAAAKVAVSRQLA